MNVVAFDVVDVDPCEEDLLLPVFTGATGTGDVDVRRTVVVAAAPLLPVVMTESNGGGWD